MRRRLGITTTGRRRASPAAAAVAMAAVLTLGGCGGDGPTGGDEPSGAGTSSGSTAPAEDPTEETPTPAPTAEPTPAAEPASGPRLDVSDIRVHVPRGWKQTIDSVVVDTALGRVDGRSGGVLLSVAATGGDVLTPKQAEKYFWTRGRRPTNYEKQDDVLMGGLTSGYYTAGDRYYDIHAATLWEDNHVTKVEVRFDPGVPDKTQQELFQSVIASYSSPRMRL